MTENESFQNLLRSIPKSCSNVLYMRRPFQSRLLNFIWIKTPEKGNFIVMIFSVFRHNFFSLDKHMKFYIHDCCNNTRNAFLTPRGVIDTTVFSLHPWFSVFQFLFLALLISCSPDGKLEHPGIWPTILSGQQMVHWDFQNEDAQVTGEYPFFSKWRGPVWRLVKLRVD